MAGPRDPKRDDERLLRREEDAAAAEAGRIGGESGLEGMDPAERASAEHGGGESEGFEQAEAMLREHASHEEPGGNPILDAGHPERNRPRASYGEADGIESTERH